MKKYVVLFYTILIACTAFSQSPLTTDTSTYTIVDTTRKKNLMDRDRFIFDLHWDGWLNAPDSLKIGPFSRGVGVHFFFDLPLDAKKQFSFAPGLGYSNSNYNNKVLFVQDTAGNDTFTPFATDVTIKRNKIVLNYIEVPLEFRYRTLPNKRGNSFKVAIGFKGGYQFSNHVTYVGEDYINSTGDQIKYKVYRFKGLSTLQYGPTFRIGYSNINLQAFYGLGPIFQDGKGPTGNPLIIGISFNPF